MRTKIIATIGPASSSKPVLARLVEAGVRIFRLNFSHGNAADFEGLIAAIRDLEREYAVPLTILQDLPGPKFRIGEINGGSAQVEKGQKLLLGDGKEAPGPEDGSRVLIPFTHQQILESMEEGDIIALADGALQLLVGKRFTPGLFEVEALSSGIITSRKGLALPGKPVRLAALTELDRKNLADGLRLGVDAVALSYVQTPEDIREAKQFIREQGCNIPVIAKLERRNAVENLEAILEETNIVMVARGDLGVECPLEDLPAMQKRIIRACNRAGKPVIVATQMLLSMVHSPSPTRAEVTDVANAVLDGADCIMLSEETAMGNYPVETVEYMDKIASSAEQLLQERALGQLDKLAADRTVPDFLAFSACLLARRSGAVALVAHSRSGATARLLSAHQPSQPIFALTPCRQALHDLNFSWGVKPCLIKEDGFTHLERVENFIEAHSPFTSGEVFVITAGQPKKGQSSIETNLVKIYQK